jgi:hypothetical protein
MRFNQDYLDFGVEIVSSEPPTIRCNTCGKVWRVKLGDGGEMLPIGCWFCPICRKQDRKKVCQIMGV